MTMEVGIMPGANSYCYVGSVMKQQNNSKATVATIVTVQRMSSRVKPGEREYRICRYSYRKDAYIWISELGEFPTAQAAQTALDKHATRNGWAHSELEWVSPHGDTITE